MSARYPLSTVVRQAAERMAELSMAHAEATRRPTGDFDSWQVVATWDVLRAIDLASEREALTPAGLRAAVEQAERDWATLYQLQGAAS